MVLRNKSVKFQISGYFHGKALGLVRCGMARSRVPDTALRGLGVWVKSDWESMCALLALTPNIRPVASESGEGSASDVRSTTAIPSPFVPVIAINALSLPLATKAS